MIVHSINPYIEGLDPLPKPMGDKRLKVIGLAGEYRATSKSGMLVNLALTIAKERGADVEFWDLADGVPENDRGLIKQHILYQQFINYRII